MRLPWTPMEDAYLVEGVLKSEPYESIGAKIGRTKSACRNRAYTLDITRKSAQPYLPLASVVNAVTTSFNVDIQHLRIRSRRSVYLKPRYAAVHLCRRYTRKSYVEIGRLFGGYDHTSMINAEKNVPRLTRRDPEFRQCLREAERALKPLLGKDGL